MKQEYADLLEKLNNKSLDEGLLDQLNNMTEDDTDTLTGFYDYRSFARHLEKDATSAGTLISISIDFLQELNILSSWVMGDLAICGLAKAIDNSLLDGEYAGRTSGSTIMVLFKRSESKEWLEGVSDAVAGLKLPGVDMFPEGKLTLSVGVQKLGGLGSEGLMLEVKNKLHYSRSLGGGATTSLSSQEKQEKTEQLKEYEIRIKEEDIAEMLQTITANGFSILTDRALLVRDQYIVIVLGDGREKVRSKCEVVWRKLKEERFAVGFNFKELDIEAQKKLELLLSGEVS